MLNDPLTFTVKVNESDSVTALLYSAPKKNRLGVTIILGHGAGANQFSGFMKLFASGLAERGFAAMTFNFVYTELGKGVPDPKAKLEACFRAVIEAARKNKKLKGNRLLVGGKSMGGRIASQVVAEAGEKNEPIADGLVFLGYPLHPPGNPSKLRVDHLPHIKVPMLFVQGTRDSLGTVDEIKPFIKKLKLPAEIYSIEGGDHSFKAPKKFGKTQEEIYAAAMDEIARWSVGRE